MYNTNRILTIFTPAYNRAHTLPRTYESLRKQKNKSFIWLIVDDGSTDDTADLVQSWKDQEKDFEIRYIYKDNGGMHTAHNVAYEAIDTELNVCIDSDDMLAEDAIDIILLAWEQCREKGYAGLIGLDADFDGNIIGTSFPDDMSETTLMGFYAKGGSGDKKLVYRTDVIKQYPAYPVFEGEKYVALAYKYRLIDQDYRLFVVNEILCNVEYQADGSTGTMYKQYLKYPQGFAFWRKICMQYPMSRKRLLVDCMHYVSSSILSHNRHFVKDSPKPLLSILMLPVGVMWTIFVKYKAKA